jgi:hypothetical protein
MAPVAGHPTTSESKELPGPGRTPQSQLPATATNIFPNSRTEPRRCSLFVRGGGALSCPEGGQTAEEVRFGLAIEAKVPVGAIRRNSHLLALATEHQCCNLQALAMTAR